MTSKSEILYSWLMFPVYAWQGSRLRNRTIRMPPPQTNGTIEYQGKGKSLNILLIGDSSAAGVGVEEIAESLGGNLAGLLNSNSGRPVRLHIAGNNSATSAHIRDHVVPHLEHFPYDYIALNIGTNDAKNFHTGNRFCRNFGTLLYALRAKWPTARVIWSGVIDMKKLEVLPSPLNRILGIRSRIINRNGEILCNERGALAPGNKDWKVIRENFSEDGFHASALGYRRWAEGLSEYILSLETAKKE